MEGGGGGGEGSHLRVAEVAYLEQGNLAAAQQQILQFQIPMHNPLKQKKQKIMWEAAGLELITIKVINKVRTKSNTYKVLFPFN